MRLAIRWHNAVFILPVCIAVVAVLETAGAFMPASRWLYDHASHVAFEWRWQQKATDLGVYTQAPLLVAIDEASLQAVGRWPWSRTIHAQLLNQLNASERKPSVVAMDIVFSEPQTEGVVSIETDEDARFARAINQASFPVVLATQLDVVDKQSQLIKPKEPLSSSKAKIAHVQIDTDADGSVRRYWPIDDTFVGLKLPYLGKAMHMPQLAPDLATFSSAMNVAVDSKALLDKEWLFYPLPKNWLNIVSYQAMLAGLVAPKDWAGLPVLVAATSKGLGDQYVSHLYSPSSVLAGGELVIGAYHTERLIEVGFPRLMNAPPLVQWGVLLGLLAAVYFGLRRSSSVRRQSGVMVAALLLLAAAVLYALAFHGLWLNAAQLVFATVLLWVLWVSHTLQRLLGFLLARLQQAGTQASNPTAGASLGFSSAAAPAAGSGAAQDAIDEQLSNAVSLDRRRQREFERLSQMLEMLPDAAFVFTLGRTHGAGLTLEFQNLAARQLVGRYPSMQTAFAQTQCTLDAVLSHLNPELTEAQQAQLKAQSAAQFKWQWFLEHNNTAAFAQGVEAKALQDGLYLVKLSYLANLDYADGAASVVLSIVDLSVSKALDEAFERTLSFLSHDLRAPQATILALLELESDNLKANTGLHEKIQYQAERTLQLAEGFVQWSQASHGAAYQLTEYNLNDLVVEALDEQWASAKQKNIALNGDPCDEAIWVKLDRKLMWRALVNLISNALNACHSHAVERGEIRLSLRREGQYGVIEISDNGPGIPQSLQAGLFQPFVQGQGLKRSGAGLGLAFVKTVLEQHQGQVLVHSPTLQSATQPAHGTRFELWLPVLPDEAGETALSTALPELA